MSERLSYSLPNSLDVLVSRATRPSRPSNSIAAKMANATTPGPRARRQRRRLLGMAVALLAAGTLRSVAAQPARPTDARSGPDPELRKILIAAVAQANSFSDRFDAEVWLTDMSRRLA